jgi:hypothetical protein
MDLLGNFHIASDFADARKTICPASRMARERLERYPVNGGDLKEKVASRVTGKPRRV